jgi:predicted nucleotidyltransferase
MNGRNFDYFEEVFKALNKSKVKYVVAGGVAVSLHGYQRLTKDLDLIVFLEKKNLALFFKTLQRIGYRPKVPVTMEQFMDEKQRKKWQREKGMIVFSFCQYDPPFTVIDMFVNMPFPFNEIFKKRLMVKIKEKLTVPLISLEHIIILKRRAGRPQDLIDLVQLEYILKSKKE